MFASFNRPVVSWTDKIWFFPNSGNDRAPPASPKRYRDVLTAAGERLDIATQYAYLKLPKIHKLNPGPSGEDAEISANLAMSDHFCAKAHGSADIRAQRFPSS
jgi:hypothetical protein